MSKNNTPHILVLGASGMLGRVMYQYLKLQYPQTVYGTIRNVEPTSQFFPFTIDTAAKNLDHIVHTCGSIDYIVNCIAELNENTTPAKQKKVNTDFPFILSSLSKKYGAKVIHISTDAVFSRDSGPVDEDTVTSPEESYGQSKSNGELFDLHTLTIRTSIIGFNPEKKKGFIERIFQSHNEILYANNNYMWAGATTLQLAQFCADLCTGKFRIVRKHHPVIHFAPIGPMTRYEMTKIFLEVFKINKQLKEKNDFISSRYLISRYLIQQELKTYITDYRNTLRDLLEFENIINIMGKKKTLALVLGIRPDIVRSALIVKKLQEAKDIELTLIWSGQHYDNNLKGVFFDQFELKKPDIELVCKGKTDAQIASKAIAKLYPVLEKMKPDAVAFLGDTNTTVGCIAAAQLNIPIIHIEGCWHSYDWRMPEEKYRTMIDHLSDVIYTYADEYKERGVAEGLNPDNIVVTGNPILDLLDLFYFKRKDILEKEATKQFFSSRKIETGEYYLMTCHRRENVEIFSSFINILELIDHADLPVYFPASYRTQKVIKRHKLKLPKNLIMVDPIGYEEILLLLTHAKAVITDSGVLPEEASILNVPCINMRKSVERPEIYDVGGAVKFDPEQIEKYTPEIVFKKLAKIIGKKWKHKFGEKGASENIANDIIQRLRTNQLRGHLPEKNHLPLKRSFREDGIEI